MAGVHKHSMLTSTRHGDIGFEIQIVQISPCEISRACDDDTGISAIVEYDRLCMALLAPGMAPSNWHAGRMQLGGAAEADRVIAMRAAVIVQLT